MSEQDATSVEPRSWRRVFISIIRGVCILALFLGTLIGACWLIHRSLPFPDIANVTAKLAHWEEHKDEYDTLFVGSSRVYEQISPAIFDTVAREHGVETHSFNFGIMGMFGPEDAFVLRKLLASHPKKLRRVFIEVSSVIYNFAGEEPDALRTQYWHDAKNLSLLLHTSSSRKERGFKWRTWKKNLSEHWTSWSFAAKHAELFLREFTNQGRGSMFTGRFIGPKPPLPKGELGPARDGFFPFDRNLQGEKMVEYRKHYADRLVTPARKRTLSPASQKNFEEVVRAIRAAHAEPIFIVSPTPYPENSYPQKADGILLLDFTDVRQWAPLYEEQHRIDYAHLNRKGAEIYSRLFAEEYFAQLARRGNNNDAQAPHR